MDLKVNKDTGHKRLNMNSLGNSGNEMDGDIQVRRMPKQSGSGGNQDKTLDPEIEKKLEVTSQKEVDIGLDL